MEKVPLASLVRSVSPTRREVRLQPVGYSASAEAELRRIYISVVRDWLTFCREVLAPRYVRPPPLVVDSDYRELQWLIEQRDAWINSRVIYQTDTLRRWVTRLGSWHGGRIARSVLSATGVRVEAFIRMEDVREALEERIAQNVSLIRGLSDETRRRVESVVFESFALRRTRRDFVRELARVLGISQRKARLAARDQAEKIQSFLTQFRQQQLGFDEYVWITMRDDRVRAMHRERDGRRFRWDSPPSDGHPGHPVNCRCLAEAYMRLW